MFGPLDGEMPAGPPVCSAKRCRRPAVWGLRWNNPKLHPPERRKVWTACDEHRADLESFLASRGFLRETVTIGELTDEPGGGAGAAGDGPQPGPAAAGDVPDSPDSTRDVTGGRTASEGER